MRLEGFGIGATGLIGLRGQSSLAVWELMPAGQLWTAYQLWILGLRDDASFERLFKILKFKARIRLQIQVHIFQPIEVKAVPLERVSFLQERYERKNKTTVAALYPFVS